VAITEGGRTSRGPGPEGRTADRVATAQTADGLGAGYQAGDVVQGTATRKIKGGLLVNSGVNIFRAASQVDVRRPADIADYISQNIDCAWTRPAASASARPGTRMRP
jgi:hypothetical protein